jgi:hypothetical protein
MTREMEVLKMWTPDYTNDEGEEFYTKGKVSIILSEYAQLVANKNLAQPDVSGSLPLLRETAMRCNIVFPENEEDEKWFNETCDVKKSGDFMERIIKGLGLGGNDR